jgi:hypothetical protein
MLASKGSATYTNEGFTFIVHNNVSLW